MSVADVAPDLETAATVRATDVRGRFVVSAGTRHFVSDARAASGGPGESANAGELLLSALGSCALAVIQQAADELGVVLPPHRVDLRFRRDPDDGTRYAWIRLHAVLPGLPRDTAQALLDRFTATCPIYNTLKRGGPIEASVATTTGSAG